MLSRRDYRCGLRGEYGGTVAALLLVQKAKGVVACCWKHAPSVDADAYRGLSELYFLWGNEAEHSRDVR